MIRYLAFDVGCIECGEDSDVVGVYLTREEAEVAADIAQQAQAADWHGQHYFEVYEIEVPE